jgi:ubiquinone biosynthesis protein
MSIRRFTSIIRVLIKHGFGNVADRLFRAQAKTGLEANGTALPSGFPSPVRLRQVLEELGPSFIKLGQLLSTRADLLSPAFIEEFRKLQDQVPAVSYSLIKRQVESDLAKPLESVFKFFDPTPMAAASVAQVHAAILATGEETAVKVVRPGIERIIRKDIRLMYALAERLEKTFETIRILGAVTLVKEFERTIYNELDMRIEAGNIERFAANFRRVKEIHLPKVYWDHSSKNVLVLEKIPGVKVDAVLKIRKMGVDPKEVALIGLRSLSRQLFDFGFFHADPHPGNTIVMPDGRVGLVDFGIVGYLDDEIRGHIALLFLGYAEHDYDLVIEAVTGAGLLDPSRMDVPSFRRDLIDASEAFYGRTLQTVSAKDIYDKVIGLVLKHRIVMPRNLLLLLKTFVQTEALGKILGSDASLLQVMKPYAKELVEQSTNTERLFGSMDKHARFTGQLVRTAPGLLLDILKKTAEGKQGIRISHTGFDEIVKRSEQGLNRLTIGIVLAASVLAAALVLNASIEMIPIKISLFGSIPISITGLFGLLGYGIATLLGIWLIVSIIRSGRL